MNFTELLIRRPVLSIVMTIIILIVGGVSYTRLSLRQFPQVDKPIISVTTTLEGASPQIIEQQLTRPIEEALGGIEGLDFMTSRSETASSVVKLNFRTDRDIDLAAADVRDRLQKAQAKLGDDASTPLIKKADVDTQPLIYVSLYSDKKTVNELADYATRYLESEFESIPGVASAEPFGGAELEMHLILDPIRLAAFGITATDVAAALKKQNLKRPAGRLSGEEREFAVTTTTNLSTPSQFNNMIIHQKEGRIVYLKDVGYAELNAEDPRNASRYNGHNAVSIGIVKKSIGNPLEIKRGLEEKLVQIKKRLPTGMFIDISSDSTVFIEKSIDHVKRTIWEATLLVIVVIFGFLRSIRASLIPLVTIPVSLIGVFALMYLFGFTINIFTLLALVLAIGLVVDDAIVVLENIYRYIEDGMQPMKAAIHGAKEISFAVIAMTLTLAAVYAPIALAGGITGKLFTEFALTLAGAVIISGFVALTLTPMMCSRLLVAHNNHTPHGNGFKRAYQTFSDKMGQWLDKLDQGYATFLSYVLTKRLWVVGTGLLIALLGVFLGLQLKRDLTPSEDQGVLVTTADADYGATLKYINKYALQMDQILASVPELEKRMTIIQVGDFTYANSTMTPWEQRTRSCNTIKELITPELDKIIGLSVRARCKNRSPISGGSTFDLSFVIQTSRSYEDLQNQMQRVWAAIDRHPGISWSQPDMGTAGQDYKVEIDVEKAITLGIDPEVIGQTLDVLIGGKRTTTFERESKQYPVKVWVGEQYRQSPQHILDMNVRGTKDNKETLVPLSDIVKILAVTTTADIRHFDKMRAVTIDAILKEGYGVGQVLSDIQMAAEKILPKSGYQTTVSGETRDFLKESYTIYLIFGLAVAFIFLVMAAQFESFVDPFVILLSVPLSLAGAVFTLWIVPNGTLNIYSQIGLVTLIGLITKHGILIVDFANKLQETGKSPLEAVIEASRLRLRPILMTTFAMVFGALPLAFSSGAGAETREQIGLVIVGGMIVGTAFTLFVIPVVYTYLSWNRKKKEA